jgi:hypothetical protein
MRVKLVQLTPFLLFRIELDKQLGPLPNVLSLFLVLLEDLGPASVEEPDGLLLVSFGGQGLHS